MNLLDRLLAHDAWTTQQLLAACETLSDELLDKAFEIDQQSLRRTFEHIIGNMEIWTDLLYERPVEKRSGNSISELHERLGVVSREFANIARRIDREQRYDDCFLDMLDRLPKLKTYGGAIGHLITHNMHHRAQVMFLMGRVGLTDHVEGDLLSWETIAFGWK